ncbi:hypothetical protein [Rufibacter quisquiliarum]|uniref:Phospholipase D-like domain-containing protein n=1 Tax=Rufibacter quisquiliarum TaxID=1549639 RepID=A0A839GJW4_9BACT|nr:hypothetical protein [Rufibacter quisquiliarum]MBA9077069.1 hypothetical protein [Rufibacter quisquiliarum]
MQLIKPSMISGEIMTLIEEADEKLIIVTPYCRISKWYKLLNKLEDFKRRRVGVEFYVREGEYESACEVRAVGFDPIEIPHLHAKLYLNEKYGIVSSMNLLLSSETNSLEIAYKTTTEVEYQELVAYYMRYLVGSSTSQVRETENLPKVESFDWREYLFNGITKASGWEPWIQENENQIRVKTNNTYVASVDSARGVLQITGIVTQREFEELQAKSSGSHYFGKGLAISLVPHRDGDYNRVMATTKETIQTKTINEPAPAEEKMVADAIIDFVAKVDEWKQSLYSGRR